jgi:putative transposase
MPRPRRAAEGGLIYHALSRANARLAIFGSDADNAAFERVLRQAIARIDMRLVAYCLMPNRFHLLYWPREDGDLSTFMRWLTMTHTQRWHAHHRTAGTGHLYQCRYTSQSPSSRTSIS